MATTVSLLDLRSGHTEKVLDLRRDNSPWVSISADERYLARNTVPGGNEISVVDLRNGKTVLKVKAGAGGDPQLNADGSRFLINGLSSVELWDVASGRKLRDFPVSPCCTWFNQDETQLYTAGSGIQAWDVETGRRILNLEVSGGIGDAQSSSDDKRLATFSADGAARVLSLQPIGEAAIWDLGLTGFNPSGSLDLAGSRGAASVYDPGTDASSAAVFDRSTGHVERILKNTTGQSIRLSPDDTSLAAQQGEGSKVGAIVVHDLATGESVEMDGLCMWDLNAANPQCKDPPSTPFAQEVWDVAFSSDGSLLASGSELGGSLNAYNNLAVWNSITGKLLWSRGHLGQAVVTIAFSPDGRRLVAETGDGSLLLFDSRTGKELKRVSLRATDCGVLRFTPDARHLICSTIKGLILIYDTGSWKALRVLRAHQGRVKDMEVSPDGNVIASSGDDGFVRTWDLSSGALLQVFSPGEGPAQDVEFLDDRHLAVRGASGPILIYTLDTDELLEIARDRLTRGFTQTECRTSIPAPTGQRSSLRKGDAESAS